MRVWLTVFTVYGEDLCELECLVCEELVIHLRYIEL